MSLQDDKSVETIESVLSSMTISEPKLAGSPVVYASRGLAELTGYSKEDLLGRSMFKVQCRQHQWASLSRSQTRRDLEGQDAEQGSVLFCSGLTSRKHLLLTRCKQQQGILLSCLALSVLAQMFRYATRQPQHSREGSQGHGLSRAQGPTDTALTCERSCKELLRVAE